MTGDCWPTATQTELLRAALLDDAARAHEALGIWLARVDLDRLDRGSMRLLPLLVRRVPPDSHLLPRFREEYARAESRNTELLDIAAGVLGDFRAAGIETVVLKGMALVVRGHVSRGERPMADCDLLVPDSQALTARDVLVAHGWRAEDRLDDETVRLRHSVNFRNPEGRQIDLHWHVLAECCEPGADADFWQASEPAQLNGEPTRTLCAADMVFHACVHGLQWSIVPPVRWVVDAVTVIRATGPSFDWMRIVEQAERRMLVLQVADTLRYLRDSLDVAVPNDVFTRLARAHVPGWAHAEYRVKMHRRSRARQALYHWYLHRRLHASRSAAGAALRFPSYLRRRLGV